MAFIIVYRKRNFTCSDVKELQFDICDVQHVNNYNQFTSSNVSLSLTII